MCGELHESRERPPKSLWQGSLPPAPGLTPRAPRGSVHAQSQVFGEQLSKPFFWFRPKRETAT